MSGEDTPNEVTGMHTNTQSDSDVSFLQGRGRF